MSSNIYSENYLDNALQSRGYYSDRDVGDTPKLPYDMYDIKIKPNEMVLSNAINTSFRKIYDNLLYIISQTRISQSVIPNKQYYNSFIGVGLPIDSILAEGGANDAESITTEDDDTLLTEIDASPGGTPADMYSISGLSMYGDRSYVPAIVETASASELSGAINGHFMANPIDGSTVAGVIFTKTSDFIDITMIQDKGGTVDVISQTNRVDNYTNRMVLSIDKIISVDTSIYTLNISDCVIYKYDAIGLYTRDQSYLDPSTEAEGKLLTDVIGGFGSVSDSTKFSKPTAMSVDDFSNIYVADTSLEDPKRTMMKKYDSEGNYQDMYEITDIIKNSTVVDFIFARNRFYLLAHELNTDDPPKSISGVIYEFTSDFEYINHWTLNDKMLPGESYKQLIHSKDSDHIVYVTTNRNIYKKFISKLDGGIGRFIYTDRKMYISDHTNLSFVSCVSSTRGEYVYVCDSGHGLIYKFNENVDYQEATDQSYEHSFIPLHEIEVKPDEYVNSLVYNKSLAKLFFNHASIGNSITQKFLCEYGEETFLKLLASRYLMGGGASSRQSLTLEGFIGINEVLLSATINRTLQYLYNFQLLLLADLSVVITDEAPSVPLITTSADALSGDKWLWVGDRWETVTVVEDTPELAEYME